MGWISTHCRFQNGLQSFSFKVESTGNVTDKFCVRIPFEQESPLRINAGFLFSWANSCIANHSLLVDEYAVVTTARLHYFIVMTAFDLSPYCLGCYAFNFGKLGCGHLIGCGHPQNKRLRLSISDNRVVYDVTFVVFLFNCSGRLYKFLPG